MRRRALHNSRTPRRNGRVKLFLFFFWGIFFLATANKMFLNYLATIDQEFAECITLFCLQHKRKALHLSLQEMYFPIDSFSENSSDRMDLLLNQAYVEIAFFNRFLQFGKDISVSRGFLKFIEEKKSWICQTLKTLNNELIAQEFSKRLGLNCS